jgi:multicomponent Na+:H+ antiporter subunit G
MKDFGPLGLLIMAVAAAWLGTLGFARLRTAIDRLHCVTFVNVVSGLGVVLAAVLSDGISIRWGKIVLILALNLIGGAAISHVTARALLERGGRES